MLDLPFIPPASPPPVRPADDTVRADSLYVLQMVSPPRDLAEALANDELALVVGTGVSYGATGASTTLWVELLLDGIEEASRLGRLPLQRAAVMRAELATGQLEDLLSVGNKITSALGGRQGGDFRAWMRNSYSHLAVTSPQTLDAIRDITGQFPDTKLVTTNYDDLISVHLGWPSVTWDGGPDKAQRVLRGREAGVIHVHGLWSEPESIVLGQSAYDELGDNASAANLLRTLATMRTLLFVGFGGGLNDPTFTSLMRFMAEALSRSGFRNYQILTDADADDVNASRPLEHRLIAIGIGSTFSDLPRFLRQLRADAVRAKFENPPKGSSGGLPKAEGTATGEGWRRHGSSGVTDIPVAMDFYGSIDWTALFARSSEIDIFVTYAYTWRRTNEDALKAFFARPGGRLRVILPDPHARSAAEQIATRAGQEVATLLDRVREAIKYFVEAGAQVRLLNAAQTHTYYRFGDQVVVALYPHSRGQVGGVPTLVTDLDSGPGRFFERDFEAVWGLARSVDPGDLQVT